MNTMAINSMLPASMNTGSVKERETTASLAYQTVSDEYIEKAKAAAESGVILKGEAITIPTPERLMADTSKLYNGLDELFAKYGIEKDPPVSFDVASDGEIKVKGDRDDLEEIEKLVNEDPEIKRQIQNVTASAEIIAELARSAAFSNSIADSDNPEAIAAKYSNYTSGKSHIRYSLIYGEGYSDKAANLVGSPEIMAKYGADIDSYGLFERRSTVQDT